MVFKVNKFGDKIIKQQPKLNIKIGKKEYGTTAFLSVRDMEFIGGIDFDENNIYYREISLSVLRAHLIAFSEESIDNQEIDDSEIERFIDAYINSSKELKLIYSENKVDEIYERFISSLRKRTEELNKQLVENLQPALQDFAKAIKAIIPPVPKLLITPQLQESLKAVSEISKLYADFNDNNGANIIRIDKHNTARLY